MVGWVDAHSHIWTRDVERYPLREGVELDDPAAGFTVGSWTAEELLEGGAECGVAKAVLISHGSIYGLGWPWAVESFSIFHS